MLKCSDDEDDMRLQIDTVILDSIILYNNRHVRSIKLDGKMCKTQKTSFRGLAISQTPFFLGLGIHNFILVSASSLFCFSSCLEDETRI